MRCGERIAQIGGQTLALCPATGGRGIGLFPRASRPRARLHRSRRPSPWAAWPTWWAQSSGRGLSSNRTVSGVSERSGIRATARRECRSGAWPVRDQICSAAKGTPPGCPARADPRAPQAMAAVCSSARPAQLRARCWFVGAAGLGHPAWMIPSSASRSRTSSLPSPARTSSSPTSVWTIRSIPSPTVDSGPNGPAGRRLRVVGTVQSGACTCSTTAVGPNSRNTVGGHPPGRVRRTTPTDPRTGSGPQSRDRRQPLVHLADQGALGEELQGLLHLGEGFRPSWNWRLACRARRSRTPAPPPLAAFVRSGHFRRCRTWP